MKLIHFWEAVDRLAKTEAEKAKALGLSDRAFRDWKRNVPRPLRRLVEHPELIEALARDARENEETVTRAS